jgi:predicted LPLAT superfamily acyltransferase
MVASWKQQRERGSRRLLHLAAWLTLTFGRRFGCALMLPISLYFALFSQGTTKVSRRYLERALPTRVRFWHVFRHYLTFSITIMDRFYFLTNRLGPFRFEVKGAEHLMKYAAARKGCILLGAHLGSFESLRCLALQKKDLPIKAAYYEHNSQRIDELLHRLNPAVDAMLIRLGSPHSMLEVREFLANGGIVGVLGDRSRAKEKTCAVEFLGAPAPFPIWPFRLAAATGAPLVLFFGIYLGGGRYEIVFEPLADGVRPEQTRHPEEMQELIRGYVERVEHHCRRAPYNWFNFFDFWRRPETAPAGRSVLA